MGASITPENLTVRYATPPNSEPNLTTINRLVLIRARRYRVAVRMLTVHDGAQIDKSPRHGDVGQVHCPHLIGPGDCQLS